MTDHGIRTTPDETLHQLMIQAMMDGNTATANMIQRERARRIWTALPAPRPDMIAHTQREHRR